MKTEQARIQWEKAAPGWAKWEDVISRGARPATELMLQLAALEPGWRVLDLASGAGSQTIDAAQQVGPAGHVVANDISPTMLEHVAQNAAAAGLANVETLVGAVQEVDLPPNNFDAAICRFALMLFAEPERALANVYGALKPGGRISVAVFTTPPANPFFARPMQILLKHAGKTPPVGSPGLFALGAPGILANLYETTGFVDIVIRTLTLTMAMPPAPQTLALVQEAFGAYRAVISDSPAPVQETAWAEVLDYFRSIETAGGIAAPTEVLIGAARKPA